MSFRELRNFTEMMRALGYPRLISMENFRSPNFELVADVLYWMVKLYDPDTTISDRVEFENERVEFLTSIAALLASKARLKLNTKKLYSSDGKAVQELLKLATLLYNAAKVVNHRGVTEDDTPPPPIKLQDVKTARLLASEITASGAKLYDLLEGEAQERLDRGRALRFIDTAAAGAEGSREQQLIERKLRDIIENTRQAVEDAKKEADELAADQRNLESKIAKKQEELERTEKRLKSLENVRPQFLEEAEKLEKDLQRHYEVYLDKQRNLDYLEAELDKFRRAEEEQMEEQERRLKKMRERLLKEEVDLMRGGEKIIGGSSGGGGRGGIVSGSRSQISQSKHNDSDGESSEGASDSNGEEEDHLGRGKARTTAASKTAGPSGSRRGVAESEDDEELSVNDKNSRNRAGSSSTGGRAVGVGGGSSIGGKSGGSSSGGRGIRMDDHTSDDFLDDEEDEDDDGGEDDGDGEFSGSDEEDF